VLPGNFDNGAVDELQLRNSICRLIAGFTYHPQYESIFCLDN
jgi:hypothetical protein